jgi:hypothetical protein
LSQEDIVTLEQYAYLAQILAAVAVVASLVYLGLQVRQNTSAVRASSVDSASTSANAIRQSIYESAEVTRLYHSGMTDVEALTDEDRLRFRLLMHNALWSIWNTYAQVSFSQLTPSVWHSHKPLIRRFLTSSGGKWFWDNHKQEFEERFRAEVDRVLRQ